MERKQAISKERWSRRAEDEYVKCKGCAMQVRKEEGMDLLVSEAQSQIPISLICWVPLAPSSSPGCFLRLQAPKSFLLHADHQSRTLLPPDLGGIVPPHMYVSACYMPPELCAYEYSCYIQPQKAQDPIPGRHHSRSATPAPGCFESRRIGSETHAFPGLPASCWLAARRS